MYPAAYYAPRYYARRYFPGVGGEPPAAPPFRFLRIRTPFRTPVGRLLIRVTPNA